MTRRLAALTAEQAERQRATQARANRRWRNAHPRPPRRVAQPGDRAAYMARYRRDHKAEIAARMAAYRPGYIDAHRDEIAAKKRAAYLADPARVIASVGRWKEEHPTRVRAISIAASANARAADCGADGRLSADDVMALWRREPDCLMCGAGAGLDHVVPFCRGGQNTTGNLQNLCRSCNSRKGRRLPEELVA